LLLFEHIGAARTGKQLRQAIVWRRGFAHDWSDRGFLIATNSRRPLRRVMGSIPAFASDFGT
jgi:hypothetical protein